MASSIISSFLGPARFVVTDEITGIAIWKNFKVKDVEVNSSSANTNNPIQKDDSTAKPTYTSLLSDDIKTLKIINPSSMIITGFCDDDSSIESVISSFSNTSLTLTISTKGIIAKSMAVVSVDIEQGIEMTSANKVSISLEQTKTQPVGGFFLPAQSSDASVFGVTMQQPQPISVNVESLYNKVSSIFGR